MVSDQSGSIRLYPDSIEVIDPTDPLSDIIGVVYALNDVANIFRATHDMSKWNI